MAECLHRAKDELGLDGVELSLHTSFARPHCTREDLDVLASLRQRHELALSAHIWNDLPRSDSAAEELLGWLPVCAKTGVGHLILHGGSHSDQREGIARVRRVLETVLPAFERAGVVLHLENHYAYDYHGCQELFSEPWEFFEVFSLDSPSLRCCFDTGHAHMTRNVDELLHALRPWLDYVHLADNRGIDDDHLMYRQGTVNWDGILAQLRDANFDGVFCVEYPVRENREPFNRCKEDIRRLWTA
jgi:sugar phosphate isomerase/epimerase